MEPASNLACVLRLALLLLSFLLIVKHRALPLIFLPHLYVLYSRGGRLTCDFFNFTILFTVGRAGPCVDFATLFTGDVPAVCRTISHGLIAGEPTCPLLVFLQYYPRGDGPLAAPDIFFSYSQGDFLFPLGPAAPP